MKETKDLQAVKDPDQLTLYNHIYELSKRDYRVLELRRFARRSFSLIVVLLAGTGVFFTVFYFTFLRGRIEGLQAELLRSFRRIERLSDEIQRITISELKYKNQVRLYENAFRNLKIEDGRILDYDLTGEVRKSLESLDASIGEFRNVSRGDTRFPETALTFDLGTGEDLPFVYAVLKRHGARATIFVSNEMPSDGYGSLFSERNIGYLRKLGELGCEFGNHTWSHFNLKESLYETSKKKRLALAFVSDAVLDETVLKLELERVREKFERETALRLSPYWRAPYGEFDERILRAAARAGYPYHVLWSTNREGPLDFYDYVTRKTTGGKSSSGKRRPNPYYFSSASTLSRLKRWELADPHGLRGAISIGHLGTSRRSDKIVYSLPEYISRAQSRGYRFVTLTELLNGKADE